MSDLGIRPEAHIRAASSSSILNPLKSLTPPSNNEPSAAGSCDPPNRSESPVDTGRPKRNVFSWAELLRRVFAIDIFVCAHCGGEMKLLAYISETKVVDKLLTHLGLPTTPMPLSPARFPAQLSLFDNIDTQETGQNPSWPTQGSRGPNSRGPPKHVSWTENSHDHHTDNKAGDWIVEFVEPAVTEDWES